MGGSGKALLIAGPVGWVIGFVGAAALLFAGQNAAREAVKGWTIPGLVRRTVISEERLTRKVREGVPEIAARLRTALNERPAEDLAGAIETQIRAALLTRAEDALVRLG